MDTILFIARLFIGGLFLVAGIAKLRDPMATRRAAIDFGMRELFAGPIARVLPFVEIVLAMALLPRASAPWAAAAIATLLLAFSVAVTLSILSGQKVVCHCFGDTGSTPVGWSTVARNVALGTAAATIAWPRAIGAGPSLIASWDGVSATARPLLALAALLAVAGFAGATLLFPRAHERLGFVRQSERGGLPIGDEVPAFDLPVASGGQLSSSSLLGAPTLLVFWNPACRLCAPMLSVLWRWEETRPDGAPRLLVVSAGSQADNVAAGLVSPILLDDEFTLGSALGVHGSPSAVLLDAEGRVASAIAVKVPAISRLLGA